MGVRGPRSVAELTTIQHNRSTIVRDPNRNVRAPSRTASPKPRQPAPSASPQPPKHLRRETKTWWKTITDTFELEAHQFRTLLIAAEALDRREQARAALKRHGLVYVDGKGMVRQRPEIAIEREMSNAYLRALRTLKLEQQAP
jgi:hypothetical protein